MEQHFDLFTHFIPHPLVHGNVHVITAAIVALLLIFAGLLVRGKLIRLEQAVVPSNRVTLTNVFELILENILGLMEGVIGHGAQKYFPFVATIFIFIFTSNMLGLIPGFPPPTNSINTNLACALCVFIYFNVIGIKEQGFVNYFRHFAGPKFSSWVLTLLMGMMILPIELFGTSIRPLTLSLRLLCNIFADHLVLQTFAGLVPLIVPVAFMILGIFVAFVQAFVFTLLTTIYISLAAAHEEHH